MRHPDGTLLQYDGGLLSLLRSLVVDRALWIWAWRNGYRPWRRF